MSFFSLDGPFFRALSAIFDYMIVNLLFLLLSLPVFTLGVSFTALYRVQIESTLDKEPPSARSFLRYWKSSFRSAVLPGILFLAATGILVSDFFIIQFMEGTMRLLFTATTFLIVYIFLAVALFYFPLLAFNPTVRFPALLRQAFIRSLGLLPRTVCMAILWVLPLILLLVSPSLFVALSFIWIFIWFSAVSRLCTRLIFKFLPISE